MPSLPRVFPCASFTSAAAAIPPNMGRRTGRSMRRIAANTAMISASRQEAASISRSISTYRAQTSPGLTCRTILDKGLADFTWLSQSRGFRETPQFRASNRWNMLQLMPDTLCGVGVDPDIVTPGMKDFGQFSAAGNAASGGTGHAGLPRFRVIARDGLRLRSGPGVEFPQLRLLALGTLLTEIRRQGDWSFVDTNGDGPLDGAVHNGFLEPA